MGGRGVSGCVSGSQGAAHAHARTHARTLALSHTNGAAAGCGAEGAKVSRAAKGRPRARVPNRQGENRAQVRPPPPPPPPRLARMRTHTRARTRKPTTRGWRAQARRGRELVQPAMRHTMRLSLRRGAVGPLLNQVALTCSARAHVLNARARSLECTGACARTHARAHHLHTHMLTGTRWSRSSRRCNTRCSHCGRSCRASTLPPTLPPPSPPPTLLPPGQDR